MPEIPSFDEFVAKTSPAGPPSFDEFIAQAKPADAPKQRTLLDSAKTVAETAWERLGGQAAVDVLRIGSRNPKDQQKAIETLNGIAETLNGIPKQIWDASGRTSKAMLEGRPDKAAFEAAGIVPLVGPAAQQIATDVDQGEYAKAVGGTAALYAPVAGPKIAGAVREAAPKVAGVARDAAAAVKPAVKNIGGQVADAAKSVDLADAATLVALTHIEPTAAAMYGLNVGVKAFKANRAAKAAAAKAPTPPAATRPPGLTDVINDPAAFNRAALKPGPGPAPAPTGPAWRSSGGGTLGQISESVRPAPAQPVANTLSSMRPGKPPPTAAAKPAEAPSAPAGEPPVKYAPAPYERAPTLGGLDDSVAAQMRDAAAFRKANPRAPLNGPEHQAWKAQRATPPAEPATMEAQTLPASEQPAGIPAAPVKTTTPSEFAAKQREIALARTAAKDAETQAAKIAKAQAVKVDKMVESLRGANINRDVIDFLRKDTPESKAAWAKFETEAGVNAGREEGWAARRAAVLDRLEGEATPSLEELMRASIADVKARKKTR